jgi:uncharacterized protein YyaL (SSP411 family)
MDNPTPSDNALMAEALQMLIAYTADATLDAALDGALRAAGTLVAQYPSAVGHMLAVMATATAGVKEVALVGDADRVAELAKVVWEEFRPDCVVATGDGTTTHVPLLQDRTAPQGEARAYVCRSFVCEPPVDDVASLERLIGRAKPES